MPLDEPVTSTPRNLPNNITERWADLRKAQPGLRNREAAASLGVSEAQLIASRCGAGTLRLNPDWPALFALLPALNRVMALTRNEDAVHERRGIYAPASLEGHVGLVLGPDIDLRIFLKAWHVGFAVEEDGRKGPTRSLQVFDKSGAAVHKIYAIDDTDMAAWNALVAALRHPDQAPEADIIAPTVDKTKSAPKAVDAAALLDGWAALKDTHEFQMLLNRAGATPTQAFRIAEGRFAARLETDTVNAMLAAASQQQVPIMVFVGNKGIIQIHGGPVARIERMGNWLNVLDPDFNLHLREDRFAEVWRVQKPTVDGMVTSVEVFDAAGERIVTFFGQRKPGNAELQPWRGIVHGLTEQPGDAA